MTWFEECYGDKVKQEVARGYRSRLRSLNGKFKDEDRVRGETSLSRRVVRGERALLIMDMHRWREDSVAPDDKSSYRHRCTATFPVFSSALYRLLKDKTF